ncbi:hypothetical protein PMIN06_007871 [Paraphaeosphaeria minitans]
MRLGQFSLPFDSARSRDHWLTEFSMSDDVQLDHLAPKKGDGRWLGPISRGFRPCSRQRRRVPIRYNRFDGAALWDRKLTNPSSPTLCNLDGASSLQVPAR